MIVYLVQQHDCLNLYLTFYYIVHMIVYLVHSCYVQTIKILVALVFIFSGTIHRWLLDIMIVYTIKNEKNWNYHVTLKNLLYLSRAAPAISTRPYPHPCRPMKSEWCKMVPPQTEIFYTQRLAYPPTAPSLPFEFERWLTFLGASRYSMIQSFQKLAPCPFLSKRLIQSFQRAEQGWTGQRSHLDCDICWATAASVAVAWPAGLSLPERRPQHSLHVEGPASVRGAADYTLSSW